MQELTHLSLFSGIGGMDLAAEWADFKTVGQCEWADYPTRVLEKHWPSVPKWRDIRTVTKENFYEKTGLYTATVVSGGDPCQPNSLAGLRKGNQDERFMWPEMFRVVKELLPTWVVNENVHGSISNRVAAKKCDDLESIGYRTWAFCIPACAVGSRHFRQRVFIVSHLACERMEGSCKEPLLGKLNLSNGQISQSFQEAERRFNTFESRLCRSLYGIPNGVDKLKRLGNAVVPQQIYPIFEAIKVIEHGVTVTA